MRKAMAEDLGAIKNRLGILSDDRKRIVSARLMETTHLSPTQLANILDVKRPVLYRDTIPIPTKRSREMIQLVIATDLVFDLTKNIQETQKWLMSPSSILFGDSPFEVILRGDGKSIIVWLGQRAGTIKGVAF